MPHFYRDTRCAESLQQFLYIELCIIHGNFAASFLKFFPLSYHLLFDHSTFYLIKESENYKNLVYF